MTKLPFDFALYEFLNDGYRVKSAVDVDVLERVGFEHEGDALLFGDDEDDVRVELEVGETKEHGYDKRFFGCQHSSRARHEVYIGLFMVQGIRLVHHRSSLVPKDTRDNLYLHFGFKDEVSVTSVCQTKYASKLIHCEITNVPNF